MARMEDNRRAIRGSEWQRKAVRSAGRPKRHWRDGSEGQQGATWSVRETEKVGGFWPRVSSCCGRTQPRIKKKKKE